MILLPLYWQGVRHESVVDTGLLTAPQGLGMALVMPLAGKLTDRFGGGPLALFGVIVTHGRDDPVRADRRAHVGRVAVGRDVRCAASGSASRFMPAMAAAFAVARPLRARRRDAAAERAPARRRLDRHGRARGRAPARADRRRTRSSAAASAYGTAFWASAGLTALAIIPCIILVRAERAARAPKRRARRALAEAIAEATPSRARPPADGRPRARRGPRPLRNRDPSQQLARSFKRAMAAVRRLRGRETHRPGELSDAQYGLLFGLREQRRAVRRASSRTRPTFSPRATTEMLEALEAAGLVARAALRARPARRPHLAHRPRPRARRRAPRPLRAALARGVRRVQRGRAA